MSKMSCNGVVCDDVDSSMQLYPLQFYDVKLEAEYGDQTAEGTREQQLTLFRYFLYAGLLNCCAGIIFYLLGRISFLMVAIKSSVIPCLLASRVFLRSSYWKPAHIHILMTFVPFLVITKVFNEVESFPFSLILFALPRMLVNTATRPSWSTLVCFQCLDFIIFFVSAFNHGLGKQLISFLPSLFAVLVLSAYVAHKNEKESRLMWLLRRVLRDTAEKERHRRVEAERLIQFMSHEVRNPQAAIALSVESLLMDAAANGATFAPQHVEIFHIIHSSSEFVTAILEDVLNFQRMAENRVVLDLQPFEVGSFLTTVASSLVAVLKVASIQFRTDFSSQLQHLKVRGDRHRIRQIITNFISNAAKFTPENGIVRLSAGLISTPRVDGMVLMDEPEFISPMFKPTGDNIGVVTRVSNHLRHNVTPLFGAKLWIRFAVCDTGVGISSEDQKKLFKVYSQIRPGELQNGSGMGLGLSICKGLAELQGGRIGVHSAVNQGAEFYCDIPFECLSVNEIHVASLPSPPLTGLIHRNVPSKSISPVPTQSTEAYNDLPHDEVATVVSHVSKSLRAVLAVSSVASDQILSSGTPVRNILATANAFAAAVYFPVLVTPTRLTNNSAVVSSNRSLSSVNRVGSAVSSQSLLRRSSFRPPPSFTDSSRRLIAKNAFGQSSTSEFHSGAVSTLQTQSLFHDSDSSCDNTPMDSSGIGVSAQIISIVAGPGLSVVNSVVNGALGHVLVTDDSQFIRSVIGRLLTQFGFTHDFAEHGAEMLAKVSPNDQVFDVLVVDMIMPIMDGPTAVRTLREQGCKLPILGLSGNSSPADTALFVEAGATRVLSKPIKADQLRSTLMELIESRHPVSVSRILSPLELSPSGPSNDGQLNSATTDHER